MKKSADMNLSASERSWLPWFGKTGKLAMGWACWLNQRRYPVLEQTFEGIAATRVKILKGWASYQWSFLETVSNEILRDIAGGSLPGLQGKLAKAPDFSELFVIDTDGKVTASTYSKRLGA